MPSGPGDRPPAQQPSIIYLIGRLDRGIRREMQKRLVPWSLSIAEYTTLSLLTRRPGLSNAQLSRRAFLTPQSMMAVLGALEDRGFVERVPDVANARILRAEVTDKGTLVLEAATPTIDALQEAIFPDLPAWQRDMLTQTLLDGVNRLNDLPSDS
jgi:DNA-binding MarR family transcriptional regulator